MVDKDGQLESGLLDLETERQFLIRTDPHCHLLPGLDDGAVDLQMSLAMARRAALAGVRTIIATPHGCHPLVADFMEPAFICDQVRLLNQAIRSEGIPVMVKPGSEYLMNASLPSLFEEGRLTTWAGEGRYILVELGFRQMLEPTWEVLNYFIAHGLTPIVAHPERYVWLSSDSEAAERLVSADLWLQFNVMSLNGLWGERSQDLALALASRTKRWIAGTDSHNTSEKYWGLESAKDVLKMQGLWPPLDAQL
jgi:protein-tyrosine phosphatase